MKSLLVLATLCLASAAFAGSDHKHPTPKVSAEFEKMKALVGTWEGKTTMHGKEEDTKVTYTLTSNGTALVETMQPGTPMEMVTIYANRGNKVHATHFCALGNQPSMTLKKAKDNTFQFEMVGTNGISNKNEEHMRAVTLTLEGDKLKQDWTNYKNNKKSGTVTMEFTKS